ncbi:MAG TPA: tetratricopeptide repeat protein [Syntrophales bacterium]|nr:tetratricopeptide repeat protein [Syntrophales bacterium]
MIKLDFKNRNFIIYISLILITVAAFWQVYNFDFVRYDDDKYVTENSHVRSGFTKDGFVWAFTSVNANNWHPLTWLSHMLDCQLYGLNPAGHHLTNLFLHILNTLLLFFIFNLMTGFMWRSAFVAALFAIHPLHVESVAWVAERKDVLSTLFFMLTLWSYINYIRRPGLYRYLPVLLFFILGLMSKPMLVTLPFVLLLLDFWPLGRLQFTEIISSAGSQPASNQDAAKSVIGLLIEKIPLFIISAASVCVTLYAQWTGIASFQALPFGTRISNALVSFISYMAKMVWPVNLAVFYPYPDIIPIWQIVGSILLLILITLIALRSVRRYPYVMTGWLWYLGTLVPVIGLVQVGNQSLADRYTYIPMIGLFMIIAWSVPDLLARWRYHRTALVVSASLVIVVLTTLTVLQVRYWRDSIILFEHALGVTKNNYVMHSNLGASLAEQGKYDDAVLHYTEALRIKPDDFEARYNIANALARQGKMEESLSHYAEALRIRPDAAAAHNNMGIALSYLGRTDEAAGHFREALRIKPDFYDAEMNLKTALNRKTTPKQEIPEIADKKPADPKTAEGRMQAGLSLFQKGRFDEAIPEFEEALRLNPKIAAAHVSLGLIMAQKRNLDKAIHHFCEALLIKPDLAEAHNSLGVALTYKGEIDEAITHFEKALRINPKFAKAHNSLAVALAQKGRTDEAIDHLRRAVQLQPNYEEAKRNLDIMLNIKNTSGR